MKSAACQEDQQQLALFTKLVCTDKCNMGMHWPSPGLHHPFLDCLISVCSQTCPLYSEAAIVCYAMTDKMCRSSQCDSGGHVCAVHQVDNLVLVLPSMKRQL